MSELTVSDGVSQTTYGWLGTTASQVFIMQLGFVCYEAGFVHPIWTSTIIHKNIQDTFVGILTYLLFTHAFVVSPRSFGGIISIPNDIYLITTAPEEHADILIACMFATTCATIISGGVLERMKNKVYLLWCFLTILITYSFIAHWIWSPLGWLNKLGFIDGGGSFVVHCVGGVAATIAIYNVGPRNDSIGADGQLKKVPEAFSPIIVNIGAFILWYGWFGFNIASAVSHDNVTPEILDTVGLVTMMGATASTFSAMILMMRGWINLRIETSMTAMLAGLVSVTASCYTLDIWAASIIGFFACWVCFAVGHVVRWRFGLDDPLNVIGIHLGCGIYACIMQGIFANDFVGRPGLVYGGFGHFGIQLLGTLVCLIFTVCMNSALWFLMKNAFFRATSIRVTLLDSYLGANVAATNMTRAFREIMNCNSNLAKQLVWEFHVFTDHCFNSEGLDFLMAVNELRDLIHSDDQLQCKKHVVAICKTYVAESAENCINISGSLRNQIVAICAQFEQELKEEKQKQQSQPEEEQEKEPEKELELAIHQATSEPDTNSPKALTISITYDTIFEASYSEIFKIMLPYFQDFMKQFHAKRKRCKFRILIPFYFETDWRVSWDGMLQKETKTNKTDRTLASHSLLHPISPALITDPSTPENKSGKSGKSGKSDKSNQSTKSNKSRSGSNRSGRSRPDPWVEAIAMEQMRMKTLALPVNTGTIESVYDEYHSSFSANLVPAAADDLVLNQAKSENINPYQPTDPSKPAVWASVKSESLKGVQ